MDCVHAFIQSRACEQAVVSCTAAYESALAVASTEKEKAYILTAQALLQHQQGNLDLAKTLLFKWWVHCVNTVMPFYFLSHLYDFLIGKELSYNTFNEYINVIIQCMVLVI